MENRVTRSQDGKYRWAYEVPMMKNLTIFWTVIKVLFISLLIVILIPVIADLFDGVPFIVILRNLRVFGYVFLALAVIAVFSYWLVSWIYGGSYKAVYEMDEDGITTSQTKEQSDKAKAIGAITAVAGLAARSHGAVSAGVNSMNSGSFYSRFSKVRTVKADRGNNVIKMNAPFNYNQIYVCDEDFDFVAGFIAEHCPNATTSMK
ncbi:MAG: hypothetical protein IKD87_01345 [Oscillospiraceae bacterium]|nr:hypothetical protein [Oscillospiraceae bacterium]